MLRSTIRTPISPNAVFLDREDQTSVFRHNRPVKSARFRSSLVVPAISFQTLTENAPSRRRHKKGPKRHILNSAGKSTLAVLSIAVRG